MRRFKKFDALEFWSAVEGGGMDDCWNWQSNLDSNGYGQHHRTLYGRHVFSAHRIAYEICKGHDPGSLNVCHKCDNRKCVNPSHLFLGTIGDNQRDKTAKGRTAKGEKHGRAKLTAAQVLMIRERINFGETQKDLAVEYGVAHCTINFIATRTTWQHI